MTVPTSSLIAMGAAAAFCALLPIGILIWWRRTERTRLLPALWGALAFLLFARVWRWDSTTSASSPTMPFPARS